MTSGSNYWNSNNYQTVSCNNFWNMSCHTKRLQLKKKIKQFKVQPFGAIKKTGLRITG